MAGIYDDTVEVIECQAQMEPFNLEQLNVIVATLEQKRQGFDISSVTDPRKVTQQAEQQDMVDRLQYPSTSQRFLVF